MRVGIYARSATGDAAQVREQEARCRDYAAEQGWVVAEVWSDGVSGLTDDRPGLRALREAMAARQVEAVVATDAARFARDMALLKGLCAEAEQLDVALVLVDSAMDSPSLGRLLSIAVAIKTKSTRRRTTRSTT